MAPRGSFPRVLRSAQRMLISWFAALIVFMHFSGPSVFCQGSTSTNSTAKNSFLWRIEVQPPSFLFGTIHLPYTRVWDAIPINAKQAFQLSDNVFFELDLTDPHTLSDLSACQLLPRGIHLSQVIPSDLYLRLKHHLDYVRREMPTWLTDDQYARGIDADYMYRTITSNWEKKQPIWVTLMVNSLTKSDIASRGVPILDLFLLKMAKKMKKQIGAIENVEDQCKPLNNLNRSQVLFALNQTLKQQNDIRLGLDHSHANTDLLIHHYRHGDLDGVIFNQDTFQLPSLHRDRLTNNEEKMAREFDEYFKDHLIHRRNKRMAARVIDLLVNKPDRSYFFAFGAGHFLGQDSMLDIIRSAGFRVTHVTPTEVIQNSWSGHRKHTVKGTFEDLSDEEKTRALLKFLQYHQQLEQETETKRFQDLVNGLQNNAKEDNLAEDEKAVEESLRVWYGINAAPGRPFESYLLLSVLLVAKLCS